MGRTDPGLPIVDHHCHLSPTGEGVAAVRRFRSLGGTHLFLCTQAYDERPPMDLGGYERQFDITERLAQLIRRETGAVVYVVLAPFPVDLLRQAEHLGRKEAIDVQNAALDLAGSRVREGRAIALGEVGRAHFSVPPELASDGREVFHHALAVARDADCPVLVHSEDLTAETYRELAEAAARAGIPTERVVKHFARTVVPLSERSGLPASFVARRETVAQARELGAPYFLETDFLDDPGRPGAVLDLATIPRRARAELERSPEAAERLRVPFVESVRRVYGRTPTVEEVGVA